LQGNVALFPCQNNNAVILFPGRVFTPSGDRPYEFDAGSTPDVALPKLQKKNKHKKTAKLNDKTNVR
jgi:hypothetical protein